MKLLIKGDEVKNDPIFTFELKNYDNQEIIVEAKNVQTGATWSLMSFKPNYDGKLVFSRATCIDDESIPTDPEGRMLANLE